jgi:putative redox protein
MHAELKWTGNMQFVCDNHGLISNIDATKDHGGADFGPTPKELVLNAMMGCTAMDVIAMLKKMRQDVSEFNMSIEAEKTTQHPIHFKTAMLNFRLKGNLDIEKLIKSVDSSLTKYCGVNYMISKTCKIKFTIYLNDTLINQGSVNFTEPKEEE